MSVSFEDALNTLTTMFPEWDRDTLSVLLTSNGYHVERTIESVLSMSGEMPAAEEQEMQAQQQKQQDAALAVPKPRQTDRRSSSDARRNKASGEAIPAPGTSSRGYGASRRRRREVAQDSPYRGIIQNLPDDFLRVPTGSRGRIIADEELAMMLQNELFQKEVQRMLGDEFFEGQRREPASDSNSRRGSRTTGGEDLGILKALSSMGGAAKRNLSALADRFSSNQNRRGDGNEQHVMHYGETAGESGNARELKSLVGDNDEDDEDEVISFGGGGGGHHRLDDEPTSNPLIRHGGSTVNGAKKTK